MRFLCLAVVINLAACASLGSSAAVPTGPNADGVRAGSGSGTCNGSGGTSISPCPVTLTYKGDNVMVKVSAKDIAYTTFDDRPCHVPRHSHTKWHHYCHVTYDNGYKNRVKDVYNGKVCGSATVPFKAFDKNGHEIGTVRLPITNQVCKQ